MGNFTGAETAETGIADKEVVDSFLKAFDSEGHTALKARDYKAYMPHELLERKGQSFDLYGHSCKETDSFYVVGDSDAEGRHNLVGHVEDDGARGSDAANGFQLEGSWDGSGKLSLALREEQGDKGEVRHSVRIISYELSARLFSRNCGLLESDAMLVKCALIVGCGSVGSLVALELARSGVGRFVLCDTDTLEIHNICRHQCGFSDLGRYKVDAVKDRILDINPSAKVAAVHDSVEHLSDEDILPYLGGDCVIVAGGDNRASAAAASRIATSTGTPMVAIACWTRAHAGEVFWWAPGKGMPCYECAFEQLINDDRPQAHSHYFGTDDDAEMLSYEPGIAVDIDYVTLVGVKLALDLLNRDDKRYTKRLIDTVRQLLVICNTNKKEIGGEMAQVWNPLEVKSLNLTKREACPHCGGKKGARKPCKD